MRVQVLAPGQAPVRAARPDGSSYGGWRPRCVLGAASAGALMLPDAHPTAATLYAPRGVWIEADRVIAADTGNHRVMIWNRVPTASGEDADVVLGHPDAVTEGEGLLHLPTGLLVTPEGALVVADAWHHRLLVWDAVPTVSGTAPDHVIGQASLSGVSPNAGGEATAATFYWPFGIALVDGRFHVADTGNRRVLVWRDGVPRDGRPADVVLGQPDATAREENRGDAPSAASFRWPHAVAPMAGGGLWVADAGNHRLLGWSAHPEGDVPADRVLGQPDFSEASEFPYVPQIDRFRFPYGVVATSSGLAVADTANNRVLLQAEPLTGWHPTAVLAQPDLAANGENRWEAVADDTLCWPYGLDHCATPTGELLAIADSGNNRVVLWEQTRG